MATFKIEGTDLDLPRNLALLDSNILIAFALADEPQHAEASIFLECKDEFVLGVAPPVIGEVCSFLIGKRKRRDRALWLVRWLLTPGNCVKLLPAPHNSDEDALSSYLRTDIDWMDAHGLDFVDSYLMHMADTITETCKYRPDVVIVTSDLNDYLRCFKRGCQYRVYDISNNETYDPN